MIAPSAAVPAKDGKGQEPNIIRGAGISKLENAIEHVLTAGPLTRNEIAATLELSFGSGIDFGEKIYHTLRRLEGEGRVIGGGGSTRAKVWKLADQQNRSFNK